MEVTPVRRWNSAIDQCPDGLGPTHSTMVFIQFEAMPPQAISTRENVAGAYVNCWIQADDATEAEKLARQWLADEDWGRRLSRRVPVS